MNKSKAAALILCLACSAPVLSGCAATDNMALIKVAAKGKNDKITYGYAKFDAHLTQAMYETTYSSYFGDDMWSKDISGDGSTMEDTVKKNLIKSMEEQYVLVNNAEDYKIKLSSADKKKISKAAKKFMKNNSKSTLNAIGASQELAEEYLRNQTISDKVKTAIEAEADTTVTDEEANQKKVSYVFFNTITKTDSSGKSVAVTSDDEARLKEQAEELAAAGDFDSEVSTLGLTANDLTFGATELKDARKNKSYTDSSGNSLPYDLLKACDALSDGQTTSVIKDNKGFYVAHMVSVSDSKSTETERKKLEQQKKSDYYDKVLKKYESKISFDVNKFLWKQVRFLDKFKLKQTSTNKKSGN